MSFEENLISLVKEEEYLFNTKSRSYKNATKRAVAWDKISAQLKRPVQDCKQRWRSLRDRFTREHRCMTSLPSGSAAIVEPDDKWELYDSLKFLIPSLLTRKQIGNTEVPLAESAAVTEEIMRHQAQGSGGNF
ncbi:transcription factor Adf-1-like [Eupeodes corollae]|uniref:transcription factor Adf-1-like n=1 Tax=Eupeodes corollae TaxID=290404 RepID=UPI002491CA30|nr:transcription factor Adf-1-like [Eupeodes corollae]